MGWRENIFIFIFFSEQSLIILAQSLSLSNWSRFDARYVIILRLFFSHLYFRSHLINYNDLYEFTLRFVSNFCVYNKNQDNCENVVKKYNQDHHIHYLLIKNNFHRACLLSYDDIFVKYFPRATYETSISLPRQ